MIPVVVYGLLQILVWMVLETMVRLLLFRYPNNNDLSTTIFVIKG